MPRRADTLVLDVHAAAEKVLRAYDQLHNVTERLYATAAELRRAAAALRVVVELTAKKPRTRRG